METVWEFKTANLHICLEIAPEDMDPADSFQFQDDIDAVRDGKVEWFMARLAIYDHDGHELGADHLGGCAYYTVREFYTSHRDSDPMGRNCSIMRAKAGQNVSICHYFPSMVSEACAAARQHLKELHSIRVRA